MLRTGIALLTLTTAFGLSSNSMAEDRTAAKVGLPPPSGVEIIVPAPSKANLFVRLSQYSGLIKVDGWTSLSPGQHFWNGISLTDRPLSIPTTGARDYVKNCMAAPSCANGATEWLGSDMVHGGADRIDAVYSALINAALGRLEADLTPGQSHDLSLAAYVAPGKNKINYLVVSQSQVWSATFELYTISPAGHIDVLQETHLDQSSNGQASVEITLRR